MEQFHLNPSLCGSKHGWRAIIQSWWFWQLVEISHWKNTWGLSGGTLAVWCPRSRGIDSAGIMTLFGSTCGLHIHLPTCHDFYGSTHTYIEQYVCVCVCVCVHIHLYKEFPKSESIILFWSTAGDVPCHYRSTHKGGLFDQLVQWSITTNNTNPGHFITWSKEHQSEELCRILASYYVIEVDQMSHF